MLIKKPSVATNSALAAVENKVPDVSSLVKKADYDTKISEIENKVSDHNHDKYITTPKFNILASRVFNARQKQKQKTKQKPQSLNKNKKINSNKTKHLPVENEKKN